jgi:GT2 family glycosyltransferase
VLVDDDVRAPEGWLAALLRGASSTPDAEVFGGPIRAAIAPPPHSCGREGPPITHLDLGPDDRDTDLVWSANMAIRRAALARVGPFDETIQGRGEEEDWERRFTAGGGRVRYLGAAGLEHRRVGDDARLSALSRAAYALGRTARRYDVRRGTAPSAADELWTLAACLIHIPRFRCANMVPGAAHAAGRLREALSR